MNATPVTAREVEALVQSVAPEFGSSHPPDAVAVVASGEWDGPDEVTVAGMNFVVRPCVSVLAVRDALGGETPAVILSPFGKEELGTDVCARIAKGRPITSDRRDTVAHLFGAATLEPRLTRNPALLDLLVAATPAGGYQRVTGRVLTEQHALRAVTKEYLGLLDISPSPATLLAWADEEDNRIKLLNAPQSLVTMLFEEVLAPGVPFAPLLLTTLQTTDGRGIDLVALGLVVGAISTAPKVEQRGAATTNLKNYLGVPFADPAGEAWGEAAADVLADRQSAGEAGQSVTQNAEAILEAIDGVGLADASPYFPSSYSTALAALGQELVAAINAPRDAELSAALARVQDHMLSRTFTRRLAQATMAVRLVRWFNVDEPDADELAAAGIGYRNEGGWVDYARRVLRNETDAEPDLAFAYERVLSEADRRRSAQNHRFAETLARWDQGPSTSIIPIEDALTEVVAPVAEAGPTLLLVMDGMGWDVWHELRSHLDRRGWYRTVDDAGTVDRPCYAAFPTVTNVSRASLLTGELSRGEQDLEKKRFPLHETLVAAGTKSKPPLVFHKGELSRSDGGGIDTAVSDAIADQGQQVVACVVNAIDDHLLKGDQVRPDWNIDTISPLGLLLGQAAAAGRTIVITADHGHILDVDAEYVRAPQAKERWRPAEGECMENEVVIEGSRTLEGGGRVYMPWVDQLRYSSGRRNGYHGGATPQEVLVPLDVLTTGEPLTGWHPSAHIVPNWWSIGVDRIGPASSESVGVVAAPGAQTFEPEGQGSLFEPAQAPAPTEDADADWTGRLLTSEVFLLQYENQSGRRIDLDRIEILVRALSSNGGRLTHRELAASTGIPEARISGALASMARILNIDGYPILSDDGDVVLLDGETAKTQFGIE